MKKKGQANLEMLQKVIIGLFLIGALVMFFVIIGNEVGDATTSFETLSLSENTSTITVVNNSNDGVGATVSGLSNLARCTLALTDTFMTNATAEFRITSGNYTTSNCNVIFAGSTNVYNNTAWTVSGTYTYDSELDDAIINDTITALSSVTDWFSLIILLGAVVVVMALLAIAIFVIKRSVGRGGGGA